MGLVQHADWQPNVGYRRFLELQLKRDLPGYEVRSGQSVTAFVNHGRWMAQCPEDGCAIVIDLAEPYFWCVVCQNHVEGWHEIVLPPTKTRTGIERLLMERPNRGNRNWEPSERLVDLAIENVTMLGAA